MTKSQIAKGIVERRKERLNPLKPNTKIIYSQNLLLRILAKD
tara:strand:- start:2184 stop:2309 length:126 start_codon:yes stop_codon:yes gene_type:complete